MSNLNKLGFFEFAAEKKCQNELTECDMPTSIIKSRRPARRRRAATTQQDHPTTTTTATATHFLGHFLDSRHNSKRQKIAKQKFSQNDHEQIKKSRRHDGDNKRSCRCLVADKIDCSTRLTDEDQRKPRRSNQDLDEETRENRRINCQLLSSPSPPPPPIVPTRTRSTHLLLSLLAVVVGCSLLANCHNNDHHHIVSASNQQQPPPPPTSSGSLNLLFIDDNDDLPQQQAIPVTTTTTSSSSSVNGNNNQIEVTSKRPPLTKRAPPFRVSESDLLPFSEFNVNQPAFADLMRVWPPTTKQFAAAAAAAAKTTKAPTAHRRPSSIGGGGGTDHNSKPTATMWMSGSGRKSGDKETKLDEGQLPDVKNHLNEDLDDTIVTADESFDQDQVREPPFWVNYLGEFGDFIYHQMRLFYEQSNKSPFSNSQTRPQQRNDNDEQQQQQRPKPIPSGSSGGKSIEQLDELLDDFYYDQYENSQVLYYGPQLVREGDNFEIGCYLPNDQLAEWTKSGKALVKNNNQLSGDPQASGGSSSGDPQAAAPTTETDQASSSNSSSTITIVNGSLKIIRRGDFLGAKQNYTLKIFEAKPGDSGNYRCTRMSRKFHKLIVVPNKISSQQLYAIQQRLLSVVSPEKSAVPITSLPKPSSQAAPVPRNVNPIRAHQTTSSGGGGGATIQAYGVTGSGLTPANINSPQQQQQQLPPARSGPTRSGGRSPGSLVPGHLIVEGQPMFVSCNISDEFVLRRLRDNPQFHLAWYKNGKLLRGSQPQQSARTPAATTSSGLARIQAGGANQQHSQMQTTPAGSNQRLQFVGANGRQLYINAASFNDAGDYLCSWARLLGPRQQQAAATAQSGDSDSPQQSQQQQQESSSTNPLAAGNQMQLLVPVKLRPFKSAYSVRRGHELRLVCQVQCGYPAAQLSWYVGNRLVDAEFLNEHPNEFKILQLNQPQQQDQQRLNSLLSTSVSFQKQQMQQQQEAPNQQRKIVEVNPIPATRQQLQLTLNGRGQWLEYREPASEKYSIETRQQQLKYLQMKLAQLNGITQPQQQPTTLSNESNSEQHNSSSSSSSSQLVYPMNQATISVLVVNSLDPERHSSRFACRATTRSNTDEVTTVIRVKESETLLVKPTSGAATLIPGTPLHFECAMMNNPDAQFVWYKKTIYPSERNVSLDPNLDDNIEIHNERLTLLKPDYNSVGDYSCQALEDARHLDGEYAVVKVRLPPYIDEFDVETSHTGKSTTVTDGGRIELVCRVRDESAPVNLTWLRSLKADDESVMVPILEIDQNATLSVQQAQLQQLNSANPDYQYTQTYTAPNVVLIEKVNNFTKRLVIESVGPEHRGYYSCMVDNGVTERARKTIFIRVKDNIVALWPFLGIMAELFILFTIIHIWETQKAQKAIEAGPAASNTSPTNQPTSKRPASGPSNAFESVPLNR